MALTDPADPRRGTINGYSNQRCRCDRCRAANRKQHQKYLAKYRVTSRVLGTHGSALAYDTGCRCDPCRESHNKRSRDYKRRRRAAG